MFGRYLLGGLVVIGVAGLQLTPGARAEELMRLGTPPGPSAEFQSQVGDRVFFSEGSAEIGARARAALEAQAAWLKRRPTLPVTVEGHADDGGGAARNMDLSVARAEAVRRRLIELGVAPWRVRTVGHGRERLIAECTLPACMAQNRRVVTVVGAPAAAPESLVPHNAASARRPPRRLH